jgi:exodeoxyribonuclease V gamma subunit
LSVGDPDHSWTAHALGRRGRNTAHATVGPLDQRAEQWLRDLVDLYDRGMCEPLPMPVKTACAYAEAAHLQQRSGNGSPLDKARREWETDRFSPHGIRGEDADAAHVQVYGEDAPIECLLTPPRADEQWNAEPHRLGRLAVRLWQPLLDGAERFGHL